MIDFNSEFCTIDAEAYRSSLPPVKAGLDRIFHFIARQGDPWWSRSENMSDLIAEGVN